MISVICMYVRIISITCERDRALISLEIADLYCLSPL